MRPNDPDAFPSPDDDIPAAMALQELRGVLVAIGKLDPSNPDGGREADYGIRNLLVIRAVWLANMAGLRAGFGFDPQEPLWPVAYIELPCGREDLGDGVTGTTYAQVSWHIEQHSMPYDGHTVGQKYERIRAFASADPEW